MDNLAGKNFTPPEHINISEEVDLKLQMLDCHESQMNWKRDHDNLEFTDFVKTCAKFRGFQCNAPYAEAFNQCQAWPRLATQRMLP